MKISTETIKAAVSAEFDLVPAVFVSLLRHRGYVRPRQLAMWFCRREGRSFQEIGDKFGNRDHTTVLHACRAMDALMASDPDWRERVDRISSMLGLSIPEEKFDARV